MQTQLQESKESIKAKIIELRQSFERLSRQCNGFVRVSPETIAAYKQEIKQLEMRLK